MTQPIGVNLRDLVISRAHHRCEYCLIPDWATFLPHEIDHIIAEQHGGKSVSENLGLSCFNCNRLKGPNIATIDHASAEIIRLFHPRKDEWTEHFKLDGPRIISLSTVAQGTANLLGFNSARRIEARRLTISSGLWNR